MSAGNTNAGRANAGNTGFSFFGRVWALILRKNSGAELAGRRRLNVVEGRNVALTLADAPASNEAKLTIATQSPLTDGGTGSGTGCERFGAAALAANTTGNNNTAVGNGALAANTSASANTAVGTGALAVSTTAASNTAVGKDAMLACTTGGSNVAVGRGSMAAATTATQNVAAGAFALGAITVGANDVAVGFAAMQLGTAASNCLALGSLALQNCNGDNNLGIGSSALAACTSGAGNTGIGSSALGSLTTGSNNVGVGFQASAVTAMTGTGNTLVGASTDTAAAGTANGVALGYQAVCASNEFALGPNLTSMNLQGAVWLRNDPGRKRLAAPATNATATLSNLTDLAVTLVAGRKYTGRMVLKASNSTAAEGVKIDFNGGTATMTSFWAVSSPAGTAGSGGAIAAGTMVSTSLAGVINYTTITGQTLLCVEVSLVCNAGGTFIPRVAENSHTSGTLTVDTGSHLDLADGP